VEVEARFSGSLATRSRVQGSSASNASGARDRTARIFSNAGVADRSRLTSFFQILADLEQLADLLRGSASASARCIFTPTTSGQRSSAR
jgi:hypothetical protein